MRRLRAGDERTSQAPGRRRARPGNTTIPCEELADGGPSRPARGADGAAATRAAPRSRRRGDTIGRKRGPGDRKEERPQWRAERRHTFARRCVLTEGRVAWRAIPSCVEGTKKGYGLPGAAKNTGDDA